MNTLSGWRKGFANGSGTFTGLLSHFAKGWRVAVLLLAAVFALAQPPGYNLSLADAQKLEEALLTNPSDIEAHITLVGYYFRNGVRDMPAEKVKEARRRHALWLIQHHPEDRAAGSPEACIELHGRLSDAEGYGQAAAAWRKAAGEAGVSAAVLANAARFFTQTEIKFATTLLERAVRADPKDARAAETLAHNYRMRTMRAEDKASRAALAQKALEQMETAANLAAGPEERFYRLPHLATMALEAGDGVKARTYGAEQLEMAKQFPGNWNYGNAIHKGNTVLGCVAAQGGDIASAREYLLTSGRISGSPQLNSFGPSMALALELLKKGERDVVLEYFELCGRFWNLDRGKLEEWKSTVRGGGIPKFGNNLAR